MSRLRLGSYLIGWALLTGGVALVGALVVGAGSRSSVLAAGAVAALADPVVYAMVARGLVVEPERFMNAWGLSLLAKLGWYVVVSFGLIASGLVVQDSYLLALGTSFVVFTCHQTARLVQLGSASKREVDRTP